MKKIAMIIIISTMATRLLSQESISVGEWRGHFPYNSLISVATDGKDKIYAASNFSLFSYNKSTGLIDIYSKINSLSDIGISCIRYSEQYSTLVVTYSNSNIDLIVNNKVINMNDIYRSNIIGNKSINSIYIKDRFAYLSCGFGIVVIDLVKHEVSDTYYIGDEGRYVNVTDIVYIPEEQSFMATSDEGLYIANEGSNLSNYTSWKKVEDMPNSSSYLSDIEYFNSSVYVGVKGEGYDDDTLLVYNKGKWGYLNDTANIGELQDIAVSDDKEELLIVNRYYFSTYNKDLGRTGQYWTYEGGIMPNPTAVIKEGDTCWVADNRGGLVKCSNQWNGVSIMPTGPEVSQAFTLRKEGDKLYALMGGHNISWVPLYKEAKYSYFTDNDWVTISNKDIEGLSDATDITDVAVDPRNPDRVFLASYFKGLIEIVNGEIVNIYNGFNSPLQAPTGYTEEYVRCGGITFDAKGNLWVTHSLGSGIANVLMADGTWANGTSGGLFSTVNNKEVSTIVIDQSNQKWIKTRDYANIYVLNDNNTPKDISDDKWKCLTNATGNGALAGQISSIAVDKDGEIWIGSDLGIKVIYYPERIFEGGNFDAQEILVEYDGTVRPLLENESITAIAVDYGNNKWIGTASSGLYYLSPDGSEEFHHFTKENSFLLSNEITAISIDKMGEVFISTSNGICSYKGESSEPQTTNEEIYAYPNPVRPEYTGPISVTGLIDNAIVKIADFSGRIVYSQKSNGGMITWDGNLPNGNRASTGVYVVFATDANGKERAVTKILFIE